MAAGDGRKRGGKSGGGESCANTYEVAPGEERACGHETTAHAMGNGACFAEVKDNPGQRFCGCPGFLTAETKEAFARQPAEEQAAREAMQDGAEMPVVETAAVVSTEGSEPVALTS